MTQYAKDKFDQLDNIMFDLFEYITHEETTNGLYWTRLQCAQNLINDVKSEIIARSKLEHENK